MREVQVGLEVQGRAVRAAARRRGKQGEQHGLRKERSV